MSSTSLAEYSSQLFSRDDDLLQAMRAEAEEQGIPQIQAPDDLARLLQILIVQAQARAVLEIGTLFAHTSILMARVMPANGKLVTLEVSPLHAQTARENLRRAGVSERVEVREGNALASLADLAGSSFDLVFIDADKQSYPEYLAHAVDLTHPGSMIVADNVWHGGAVIEPAADDEINRGLRAFNQQLAADSRLLTTFFATRNCQDAASVSVRV